MTTSETKQQTKQQAEHAAQVAAAHRLAEANSMPGVRAALTQILVEQCQTPLDGITLEALLDALTAPVAYACSTSKDWGRRSGDHAARQAVASKLGLGRLIDDRY